MSRGVILLLWPVSELSVCTSGPQTRATLFSCRKTYMFTRQLLLSTNRHAYLHDVQLSGFPWWRTTLAVLLGSIKSCSTCDYHNTLSVVTLSQAHSGSETSAGTFQKKSIQCLKLPDSLVALHAGRQKEKIQYMRCNVSTKELPHFSSHGSSFQAQGETCISSNPVMEILRVGGFGQITKYANAKKGQAEDVKVLWVAEMSTINIV